MNVKKHKMKKGFTLFELLIVLVIVAILVAIAVPTYRHYILRSNRTDAMHTLLSIQLAQEKYRMSNTTYGDLSDVWGGVTTTSGGHYTLSISGTSASAYTITASAVGGQANDTEGGTSCANLVLTYAAGSTAKTPAACWMDN